MPIGYQGMKRPQFKGGAVGSSRGLAAGTGLLDPLGSPQIRQALQRRALRTAKNQRRRGDVFSRLVGLDPMQQRQAMFDVDRDASSGLSDFLNSADENQLLGQQDFLRGNYRQERGFEHETAMAKLMRRFQEQDRPGIGALLAELLGTGVGAYFGGPAGAAAGGAGGRALGGGNSRGQQPFWNLY